MENKNNIKLCSLNLSNMEDINAYNFGEYFSWGNKWVNFGEKNDYPEYLRNLIQTSPTHAAVTNGVINLTTGEGVSVINPEQNPISNKFINENFGKEVVNNLVSDLYIYGYATAQIYNGNIVKYSPAINYRFDFDHNYIWYSEDWNQYNKQINRPVKLPIYSEGSEDELSILVCNLNKQGYKYYSPVVYSSSINYANLENEISVFHLSSMKNGMTPSFLLNIPLGEEYTDEQKLAIQQGFEKKYVGSTNPNKFMLNFSNSSEDAATLTSIDNKNIHEQFAQLSKECSEKIMIGHGCNSPLLFGLKNDGGGFGSNKEELESSYFLFRESKLKNYQAIIINFIKKIMEGNLLFADIEFITYNPFSEINKQKTTLSKNENISEVDSQDILNKIDSIAVKPFGKKINERLFDNINLNQNSLYKFVKSSKKKNIICSKFEILDNKGYLFKPSDLIKNTSDYYFLEYIFYDQNN